MFPYLHTLFNASCPHLTNSLFSLSWHDCSSPSSPSSLAPPSACFVSPRVVAAKKSLSKNAFLEMLGSKAIADPVGGEQVVRGQGADDDDDEGEGEGEGMDGRIRGSSGRYPSGNDFEDVLANDGDEDDDF